MRYLEATAHYLLISGIATGEYAALHYLLDWPQMLAAVWALSAACLFAARTTD